MSLFEPLKTALSTKSNANDEQKLSLDQLILLSFKLLAKHLENYEESMSVLEDALLFVLGIVKSRSQEKESAAFESSVMMAITQLSTSIGNQAIPYLQQIMPVHLRKVSSR